MLVALNTNLKNYLIDTEYTELQKILIKHNDVSDVSKFTNLKVFTKSTIAVVSKHPAAYLVRGVELSSELKCFPSECFA